MKTNHKKEDIDTYINNVIEYMKSEKLPGADAIRQIYDSSEVGKKVENYLEGKKSKGDNVSSEEATAFMLYTGQSQDNYNATKKLSDSKGKVITKIFTRYLIVD